jgi:hypothetical protein
MDKSSAQGLITAIDKLAQDFGSPTPDDLDPTVIQKDIINWATNPTTMDGGMTGQEHLRTVQADESQQDNRVSSQAQVLSTQLQFTMNDDTQYMNTQKNMLDSSKQSEQNMVNNQKPS